MTNTKKNELETLIGELIAIETENPLGNEGAYVEYIQEWFADRDIDADLLTEPFTDRPQVGCE